MKLRLRSNSSSKITFPKIEKKCFLKLATVKLSNLNLILNRAEPNSVELIRVCHGDPYPNFYESSVIQKIGLSLKSNQSTEHNVMSSSLEYTYSVRKNTKIIKKFVKGRVRFAVMNSYLIRYCK